jgi:hypothetical protein
MLSLSSRTETEWSSIAVGLIVGRMGGRESKSSAVTTRRLAYEFVDHVHGGLDYPMPYSGPRPCGMICAW